MIIKIINKLKNMPYKPGTNTDKVSEAIKIVIWCFDEVINILKKHDDSIFYHHWDVVALTKDKMIELEKIIFIDLKLKEGDKKRFKLKDCRCVFKQMDATMNNLAGYSVSFKNIWDKKRNNKQWLYYVLA